MAPKHAGCHGCWCYLTMEEFGKIDGRVNLNWRKPDTSVSDLALHSNYVWMDGGCSRSLASAMVNALKIIITIGIYFTTNCHCVHCQKGCCVTPPWDMCPIHP